MSRWTYSIDDVPAPVLDQIGKDPNMLTHTELRFLEKVKYREPTGCWVWDAGTTKWGYGEFRFKGGAQQAHRVSLTLFQDYEIDGDWVTRHRCPTGSKECVNPEHLKPGTQLENIMDSIYDGDMPRKFSRNEIRAIRVLGNDETLTQEEIAGVFGTDQAQICRILSREQYDWVE